jgi:arylformamidase
MNIIDISWPITPAMTAYKDQKVVQFNQTHTLEKEGVRKTTITFDSHTGTHVDAPSHFLAQGTSSEAVSLEQLIGNAAVLDMTFVEEAITAQDLEGYELKDYDIVLLKTRNSERTSTEAFDQSFVYLDSSAALYLAEIGVHAVGFDYIGIERNSQTHETHHILFKAGIAIIEGLRLEHVQEDSYFFICLPLAVVGIDGAPARAILVSELS